MSQSLKESEGPVHEHYGQRPEQWVASALLLGVNYRNWGKVASSHVMGITPSDNQRAHVGFPLVQADCEPMAGRKALHSCVSELPVAVTYQPSWHPPPGPFLSLPHKRLQLRALPQLAVFAAALATGRPRQPSEISHHYTAVGC